jgi:hypothetical protein
MNTACTKISIYDASLLTSSAIPLSSAWQRTLVCRSLKTAAHYKRRIGADNKTLILFYYRAISAAPVRTRCNVLYTTPAFSDAIFGPFWQVDRRSIANKIGFRRQLIKTSANSANSLNSKSISCRISCINSASRRREMKPRKDRFKKRNKKAAASCATPARLRPDGFALAALRSLAGVAHGVNSKIYPFL